MAPQRCRGVAPAGTTGDLRAAALLHRDHRALPGGPGPGAGQGRPGAGRVGPPHDQFDRTEAGRRRHPGGDRSRRPERAEVAVAPNSVGAQVAAIVLTIVIAIDLAMVWSRVRNWWGWLVRSVALFLCAATALAAAGIWANRQLNLFTTWSEVAGHRPVAPVAGQTTIDQELPSGSRVVAFNETGPHSGISLAAKAYLPPGYDSPTGLRTHYPVIEALAGFPGTPNLWVVSLRAGDALDQEIAAGRMAPARMVLSPQDFDQATDSECVDAVGGAKFDTFLSRDVHAAVTAQFRVRTDRAGWGVLGASTGGVFAGKLAMRHTAT